MFKKDEHYRLTWEGNARFVYQTTCVYNACNLM